MKQLLIILLVVALVLGAIVPVAAKPPAPANDGHAWGHDRHPERCQAKSIQGMMRGQHDYRPECRK